MPPLVDPMADEEGEDGTAKKEGTGGIAKEKGKVGTVAKESGERPRKRRRPNSHRMSMASDEQ